MSKYGGRENFGFGFTRTYAYIVCDLCSWQQPVFTAGDAHSLQSTIEMADAHTAEAHP